LIRDDAIQGSTAAVLQRCVMAVLVTANDAVRRAEISTESIKAFLAGKDAH